MLIAIIQKDGGEYIRWCMTDSRKIALEFIAYLKKSLIPSAIPSFFVAVATPTEITEYSLEEYINQ